MKDKLKVLFRRLGIVVWMLMCIVGLLGGVVTAFAAGKWFVTLGVLALGAAAWPTCKRAVEVLKEVYAETVGAEAAESPAGSDNDES